MEVNIFLRKEISKDVRQHYSTNRIVISLKTKSIKEAFHLSQNMLLKLNHYWFTIRVNNGNFTIIPPQITQQNSSSMVQNPTFSDALQTYFKLKGIGNDIFFRASRRTVKDVIDLLKDRSLKAYSTTDAAHFRDHMMARGLVTSTVKRVFAII